MLRVTFDSFDSARTIQMLVQNGIPAMQLTKFDKNTEAFTLFRTDFMDGLIDIYYDEVLCQEMEQVEYLADKDRVDHPAGGSKDAFDTVVGVHWDIHQIISEYGSTWQREFVPRF